MLGKRVAAAIIDILILFVVFLLFAFTIGEAESEDGGFSVSVTGIPGLLYFIVVFGYYIVTEWYWRATVGKKALGLKVVADSGGLTLGAVFIRNILRIIDSLPIFYLVGFIVAAARADRKRIGDLAAKTSVVEA